jgi:hypothetical protein
VRAAIIEGTVQACGGGRHPVPVIAIVPWRWPWGAAEDAEFGIGQKIEVNRVRAQTSETDQTLVPKSPHFASVLCLRWAFFAWFLGTYA